MGPKVDSVVLTEKSNNICFDLINFLLLRPRLLRILILIMALVYSILLCDAYRDYIAPAFSYLGYLYEPQNPIIILATLMFTCVPALLLPIQLERPSVMIVWFIYLMAYVPSVMIPVISLGKPYSELIFLQISLLIGMLFLIGACRVPIASIRRSSLSKRDFLVVFMAMFALLYLALIWNMGARFKPPTLGVEIYEVRMAQREAAATAGVAVYAISWLGKVFNPCLIVWGLVRRQWIILLFGLCCQFFMFAQGGQKAMLLLLPLLFGLDWMIRRVRHIFGLAVLGGGGIVILISILIDRFSGSDWMSLFLIRRAIATPGLLTGFYFDFFSKNEFFLYAHSFLRYFIDSPYPYAPPFLIGLHYFGSLQTSANANLWADGFANLGYLGIFLHSLIFGGVLWLMDCLARPFDRRMALLLIFPPAYATVDSALFTSLLTHGIALLTLMMWVAPPSLIHRES